MPKNQGTCATNGKIPKEFFTFDYFYHYCKQSRVKEPSSHGLCVILVARGLQVGSVETYSVHNAVI